jgi:hypothetical protein
MWWSLAPHFCLAHRPSGLRYPRHSFPPQHSLARLRYAVWALMLYQNRQGFNARIHMRSRQAGSISRLFASRIVSRASLGTPAIGHQRRLEVWVTGSGNPANADNSSFLRNLLHYLRYQNNKFYRDYDNHNAN